MREIKLEVGSFAEIFSEALKEVPPLRDYDRCPRCGCTDVGWDPYQRRHQCRWRDCHWVEETRSLPLRDTMTGRRLTPGEIVTMVLGYLMRKYVGLK